MHRSRGDAKRLPDRNLTALRRPARPEHELFDDAARRCFHRITGAVKFATIGRRG